MAAKRELTVEQYKFYKTQIRPMSDEQIMKIHGIHNAALNKWKRENDLIGKKFEPDVKTSVAISQPKDDVPETPESIALVADTAEQEQIPAEEPECLTGGPDDADKDIEIAYLNQQIKQLAAEKEAITWKLKEELAQRLSQEVLSDVKAERQRQNELYGLQRHAHGDWLMILGEEVGEVAQAMQKSKGWGKESDAADLYTELIHVAAVAVAIAEQVKEERQE